MGHARPLKGDPKDIQGSGRPPMLRSALAYAEHFGFAVFPCKPRGKEPLTRHGCNDATKQRERIRTWWKRWPDANVGVCGEIELKQRRESERCRCNVFASGMRRGLRLDRPGRHCAEPA